MPKFKVTRTYTMKTFTDWTVEEADTPEQASKKAENDYFSFELEDVVDLIELQEEVEEFEKEEN